MTNRQNAHIHSKTPYILHVIPAVAIGGAEVVLESIIRSTHSLGWRHKIINLCSHAPIDSRFRDAGAEVACLNWKRGKLPSFKQLAILRNHHFFRESQIHIGWMYHGAAFLSLSRMLCTHRPPMIWNLRSGISPYSSMFELAARTFLLACTHYAKLIIYVSSRAKYQHESIGFPSSKAIRIPNGYNTTRFQPDSSARSLWRKQLGIPKSSPVLGWVGRWHSDKAPGDALKSYKLLQDTLPSSRLIMAGTGCDPNGPAGNMCRSIGITNVFLLGHIQDMHTLYCCFDCLLLSSHSEAFPNVIAEAMLCGIPCVSTDVGDAAEIIGSTGILCPPGDTLGLAKAALTLLTENNEQIEKRSLAARQRVCKLFDSRLVTDRYAKLWHKLLAR